MYSPSKEYQFKRQKTFCRFSKLINYHCIIIQIQIVSYPTICLFSFQFFCLCFSWMPFLKDIESAKLVLFRLFPFNRGLFEVRFVVIPPVTRKGKLVLLRLFLFNRGLFEMGFVIPPVTRKGKFVFIILFNYVRQWYILDGNLLNSAFSIYFIPRKFVLFTFLIIILYILYILFTYAFTVRGTGDRNYID